MSLTEANSGDVKAGIAERQNIPNNTFQVLLPTYEPSKPIDSLSPRRWHDIEDERYIDDEAGKSPLFA
jgi:hypothetical protein